jgi:hypothetical protein
MKPSPYPAPAACTEPSLGAEATQALGHAPPAAGAAHLVSCPACQLHRAAFEKLDANAVAPAPELYAGLRRRTLRRIGLSAR